jgi:hypothetical protein
MLTKKPYALIVMAYGLTTRSFDKLTRVFAIYGSIA